MNAQKFGHSVGQFFKKIDRTLSFLPEKPRKAVVAATALAASPILAGVIISKAKNNQHHTEYNVTTETTHDSILDEVELSNINAISRNISYFDEEATEFDNLDSEAFFGEKY